VVSESERDAALSRWRVQMTDAQKIRDAKEVIEMVIVVLREAGLPVPIELSEAARALSRELRPKARAGHNQLIVLPPVGSLPHPIHARGRAREMPDPAKSSLLNKIEWLLANAKHVNPNEAAVSPFGREFPAQRYNAIADAIRLAEQHLLSRTLRVLADVLAVVVAGAVDTGPKPSGA